MKSYEVYKNGTRIGSVIARDTYEGNFRLLNVFGTIACTNLEDPERDMEEYLIDWDLSDALGESVPLEFRET
jgi:hypothetical protein